MNGPHLKKQIILKKNEERRIISGHPWVFSNEVHETKGDPSIGDVVELLAATGLSIGMGLYNPHSLITFRLLSRTIEEVDHDFFHRTISRAHSLRNKLYPDSHTYRVIHGEGDFLPGLIVDKYNDYLSVQTYSYGMDARLQLICDVLESMFRPVGIVERNESQLRTLEHLPQRKAVLRGTVSPTVITEHGLQYTVDVLEGQKTGFFLDQRESRAAVRQFSHAASVLDCFCNDGGFSLNSAYAGASSVHGVDISAESIRRAAANAELNDLDAARFEQGDVFEKLKKLHSEGARFDLIVLDPPSFTKNKKDVQAAKIAYKRLHAGTIRLLKSGGILVTASCSHHIDPSVFLDIIDKATRELGRTLQLLDWRGAAPDHPILPAVPETRYLKLGIFCVH